MKWKRKSANKGLLGTSLHTEKGFLMKIAHQEKDGIICFRIEGRLDAEAAPEAETTIKAVLKQGHQRLLFDLSEMEYISSAGLRALHGIFNQLRTLHPDTSLSQEEIKKGIAAGTYKSPHLKLLNLSKEAHTAFTLSGFDIHVGPSCGGGVLLFGGADSKSRARSRTER